MSKQEKIPLRYRAAGWMARQGLQPLWRICFLVSLRGLGYNNWLSAINGEDRFARAWARERASKDVVVFDVGANEGDFTAILHPLLPRASFHLFEPHPKTVERLRSRYRACGNVTIEPIGIGAENHATVLYDSKDSRGTERASFMEATFTEILKHAADEIPATLRTLDDYAAEKGIGFIDFLKIDTEGFEKQVLMGAARLVREDRIGTIQLEMNEHNAFSGFSVYSLTKLLPGFDLYRILADGLATMVSERRPYAAGLELARYCNVVAVNRRRS